VSALSQIERGASDPSISSAARAGVRHPMFQFLGAPIGDVVVRRNRRNTINFPSDMTTVSLRTPSASSRFSA
jgi:hypothetical protein